MKIKITHNNTIVEYTPVPAGDMDYDFIKGLVQGTLDALDKQSEKDTFETLKLTDWSKTTQQH